MHPQPVTPAPQPPRTSLVGPVVLTSVGVLLILVTAVVAAFAVSAFVDLLPTGLVSSDGTAGSAAVASSEVPGTTTVTLEPGYYDVYLVVDADAPHDGLEGLVELTGPDGEQVDVDNAPGMTSSSSTSAYAAFNVAAFTVTTPGEHTLTFPSASTPDALAVVAVGKEAPEFVSGVFGTIVGVFLAVVLGLVGFAVLVSGIVWWVVRARRRSAAVVR